MTIRNINDLEKGKQFTSKEFVRLINQNLEKESMIYMILIDLIARIDSLGYEYIFEKRGDAFNVIPKELVGHKTNKNALTIWITNSSVSLIVIGYLERKLFHSTEDIDLKAVDCIKDKFRYLTGK